jgi:hypothetical protein
MKRRTSLIILGAGALLGAELALGLLASGCSEAPNTGGERVTLATRVELEEKARAPFTTGLGWQVTIDEAYVSIGELRYFEGDPVTAWRWLEIGNAHAHPGHYQEGGAIGEMLEPTSLDLLASPVEIAVGQGVTGVASSARFSFHAPPTGPAVSELGGAIARVVGTATKDALVRPFAVSALEADVLDTEGLPQVEGCTFEDGGVDGDGTVVLVLRPSVWLDQVDFSLVTESADGAPVELAPGEIPHKGFVRGLKKAAAYGFSYRR